MKKLLMIAAMSGLMAFLSACDAGNSVSYNESYDQISYRDGSYGPTQGERPLFPLSPSGGNTYYDDTGH